MATYLTELKYLLENKIQGLGNLSKTDKVYIICENETDSIPIVFLDDFLALKSKADVQMVPIPGKSKTNAVLIILSALAASQKTGNLVYFSSEDIEAWPDLEILSDLGILTEIKNLRLGTLHTDEDKPKKRHRRTKAEIEASRRESNQNQDKTAPDPKQNLTTEEEEPAKETPDTEENPRQENNPNLEENTEPERTAESMPETKKKINQSTRNLLKNVPVPEMYRGSEENYYNFLVSTIRNSESTSDLMQKLEAEIGTESREISSAILNGEESIFEEIYINDPYEEEE